MITEIRREKFNPPIPPVTVTQCHRNWHGSIARLWLIISDPWQPCASKNRKFSHPGYLIDPLRRFPLEFCNCGGARKSRMIPYQNVTLQNNIALCMLCMLTHDKNLIPLFLRTPCMCHRVGTESKLLTCNRTRTSDGRWTFCRRWRTFDGDLCLTRDSTRLQRRWPGDATFQLCCAIWIRVVEPLSDVSRGYALVAFTVTLYTVSQYKRANFGQSLARFLRHSVQSVIIFYATLGLLTPGFGTLRRDYWDFY